MCGVVIAHRLAQGRGGGLVRLAQVPGGRARAGEGPRADGAGERPQHHVRPLVARQARSGLEARPALPADVRHGRRLAHPVLPVRATQYVVFFTFGALRCSSIGVSTFSRSFAHSVLRVYVEEVALGCRGSAEGLRARLGRAREGPLTRVRALVGKQVGPDGEVEPADEAAEGPLARVHPLVALEGHGREEALGAQRAGEAALLLVAEAVLGQGAQLQVALAAHLAHVRGLAPVAHLVRLHLLVGHEGLLADGALEGLLGLRVHLHVLLEGVPPGEVGAALGAGQQRPVPALVGAQVARQGRLVQVVGVALRARQRPPRVHAPVPRQAGPHKRLEGALGARVLGARARGLLLPEVQQLLLPFHHLHFAKDAIVVIGAIEVAVTVRGAICVYTDLRVLSTGCLMSTVW